MEILYNDYSEHNFVAEIEFMPREAWMEELTHLKADLDDLHSLSVSGSPIGELEAADARKEEKNILAKLEMIYPKRTKAELLEATPELLADEFSTLLGTKKVIESNDLEAFREALDEYIISKVRYTRRDDAEHAEMQYWPLIQVVKLFVKSPALETGLVLVDLPGTRDANAARNAIAEQRIEECDWICVLSDIVRAVDSQFANGVLQQREADGVSDKTFIVCSKADTLPAEDDTEIRALRKEHHQLWATRDCGEETIRSESRKKEAVEDQRTHVKTKIRRNQEDLCIWEGLQDKQQRGKLAFSPASSRKRLAKEIPSPCKRQQVENVLGGVDRSSRHSPTGANSDSGSDSELEPLDEMLAKTPLTAAQVSAKILELQSTGEELRCENTKLDGEIKRLRKVVKEAEASKNRSQAEIDLLCLLRRNDFCKSEIKIRRGQFPVFCVSSTAYQSFRGRSGHRTSFPSFSTVEDTEIPALQAFVQDLAAKRRIEKWRGWLRHTSDVLYLIWDGCAEEDPSPQLLQDLTEEAERQLDRSVRNLGKGFQRIALEMRSELFREIERQIFRAFPNAFATACSEAPATCNRWCVERSDPAKGEQKIYYHTWHAICRRNGEFANSEAVHDWNHDLVHPIWRGHLVQAWGSALKKRPTAILDAYLDEAWSLLEKFKEELRENLVAMDAVHTELAERLENYRLLDYRRRFIELNHHSTMSYQKGRRAIKRSLKRNMLAELVPTYEACQAEAKTGELLTLRLLC